MSIATPSPELATLLANYRHAALTKRAAVVALDSHVRRAATELFDADTVGHVSGGWEYLGYLSFSKRYVVEVELFEPLAPENRPSEERLAAAGFSHMKEWKPDPCGEQLIHLYIAA